MLENITNKCNYGVMKNKNVVFNYIEAAFILNIIKKAEDKGFIEKEKYSDNMLLSMKKENLIKYIRSLEKRVKE